MEETSSEQAGLPAVGAAIAGKYRVEGILGQGGMGAVYAARNLTTGKRVAIKWLLPEHARSTMRQRLLREARIAASVTHPNVVDIYDAGEHDGGLFLVMEYLRGRPLSELLRERGRLNPEEIAVLLLPAMSGVHAAHLAGVIHRDLKPDNIILSEASGQIVPKVVDFGASKLIGGAIPCTSLTRTGMLVGTPHYMAVEQLDGSEKVDARTDVYAFGVLLYQALTGALPFDAENLGALIVSIATREPIPPRVLRPELPWELEAITLRALARNREERFQTLEEFARALARFASPAVERGADRPALFSRAPSLSTGHKCARPSTPTLQMELLSASGVTRSVRRTRSSRLRRSAALLCCCGVVLAPFLVDGLFASPRALRATRAPAAAALRGPLATSRADGAVAERATFAPDPGLIMNVEACPAAPKAHARADETQDDLRAPLSTLSAQPTWARERESSRGRRARARGGASEAGKAALLSLRIPGRRTEGLRFDEF